MADRETQPPDTEKWNRIYAASDQGDAEPAKVLREFLYLLPVRGRALDLACGRGGNALLLARQGLETFAWDISDAAISRLMESAGLHHLKIHPEVRDVVSHPPDPGSFDVIVVSRFLHRELIPRLIQALLPGGLVFYQTFIKEKTVDTGPKNPDYLLECNELLELFRPLRIILYREEGKTGNPASGFRNEVMLIARKQ